MTLLLALSAWSSANETFCVSVDGQCDPSLGCVECQPLMWFVNRTRTIPNNSMIVFLPGEHSLKNDGNKTLFMDFYNKDNLQLIGQARTPVNKPNSFDLSPCCRIVCNGYAGFRFWFSSNIFIQWLTFEGCGASSSNTSALFIYYSINISLSHLEIKESKSYSLSVFNVGGGFVNITNSLFKRCMHPTCEHADNVRILFDKCTANHLEPTSLLLASSTISFGSGSLRLKGKGLHLWIHHPMVSVTVTNVLIANGTSERNGGNVDIYMLIFESDPNSRVQFINSHIVNGNSKHGGGLHIRSRPHVPHCSLSWHFNISSSQVLFINTTFQGNHASFGSGGGFSVSQLGQIGLCRSSVELRFVDCIFIHNCAEVGGAISINQQIIPSYLPHIGPQLLVTLDSCTFSENHLLKYKDQGNGDGIVDTYSTTNMTIRNSVFSNNNGTALQLQHSAVLFEGDIRFLNNTAAYGAAIRTCETSTIYLNNGTHVLFQNNTALIAGGAIYAGEQCLEKVPRCFYQPISNSKIEQLKKEMSLTFVNNNASFAGDAIYGGLVDHCFVNTFNESHKNNINGALFRAIFTFHPNISSMVTSDPYGVCVCDPITGEPNCNIREVPIGNKFPGENFEVIVTAVGQTNGTVPAMLNVIATHHNSTLKAHNENNLTKCRTITLALLAKPGTTENLTVSVVEANPAKENSNYYRIPKLTARVKMAPCPWVFQLNKSNGCDCNDIFESTGTRIQCDINTVSVQKPGYTWFSCIDGNWSCKELEGGTFRHGTKECKTFTQFNISDQCERGWGGRLCAHCASNYSLSLGFPTCVVTEEHCSVWKLVLLLFAFLLAGVLLVCFLAIFNLTVAEGTINGLVFFANCIHTYQNTFFHTEYESSSTSFFRVFIAWLNLDLGFQVCLYSGMTAYQKFWLECGFLLYLLLIGVVIVCLSDRFIWFTRLIGRNIVPVLSTVMLLAFPKLVRLSTRGLHCTKRNYWSTSNHIPFMWSEDN